MDDAQREPVASVRDRAIGDGDLLAEVHILGALEGAFDAKHLGGVAHPSLDGQEEILAHAGCDIGEAERAQWLAGHEFSFLYTRPNPYSREPRESGRWTLRY